MATMKVKNAAGEWVEVGSADLMSELKTVIVRAKDAYTFDLSEYIQPESNFLFFFKSVTNSSSPGGGGDMFVLDKIGETARKAFWNENESGMGWWTHISHVQWTDLFPDGWVFEGTWDNDACILTFPATGASTYGILLYNGLKEA